MTRLKKFKGPKRKILKRKIIIIIKEINVDWDAGNH
jgi:hypothetical protein